MRTITIIICLIFVFTLSTGLFASETRTFSMGQTGLFLRDNSNVVPFPGTLLSYNNEIKTELRLKDTENRFSGGVHLPFMDTDYVVGVYLNRPLLPMDPLGVGTSVSLLRATDLMFGMKMGGNDLGIRLSYASDGFDRDAPKLVETARYFEVAGGLSNKKYDVGVSFYMPSIDNDTETFVDTTKDEYSAIGIGINARYFHKASKKMQYVPAIVFGYQSGSGEYDPGAGADKIKTDFGAMNITVAGAMNYQVDENNLIILGIQAYSYLSTSIDIKDVGESIVTTTLFPAIHLGAETRISSWLVGRIGAYQGFQQTTTELKPDGGTSSETTRSDSFLNFSFGLGMEVTNFLIDVDINDSVLFQGPHILGGQADDIFTRLSVTYTFGEDKEDSK